MNRPPRPSFLPARAPVVGQRFRQAVRRQALRLIDGGWLPGLVALETHVVVCGFPRSGSTLLQLVAETCYPEAQSFRGEKSALNAQRELRRRRPLLLTKQPSDLFQIDEILEFYRGLPARARVVLTMRDPRAVLCSRYSGRASRNVTRGPDGYVMSASIWREWFAHFSYVRDRHAPLVVEYADLVTAPAAVETAFSAFIGWTPTVPFSAFLENVPKDFETKALNGVRPFDPSTIDRWRGDEHAPRIRQLLDEMPDLPDLLVHLGYERDASWTAPYRRP